MTDLAMEALFRQAVQTPLPLDKCQMTGCPFYAVKDYCSRHEMIPVMIQLHHLLPSVLVRNVIGLLQPKQRRLLTDDELAVILGDRISWEEEARVQERCYFLRHHALPYFSCDDLAQAEEWLGLAEHRYLRADQAIGLMTALDAQGNLAAYPRIAMEKVIVRRTAHNALLPRSMFSVGLCYYGKHPFLTTMDPDMIRRSWGRSPVAALAGGSGGGGGSGDGGDGGG